MLWQWLTSHTVRQATDMWKHVRKLLNAQRDILSPQAVSGIEQAVSEMRAALAAKAGKKALLEQMDKLEEAARKWLKPYPNANARENVEVILVAIAVAMGIRTFFLQPFKIPTGSMQPTLYGITSENFRHNPEFKPPGGLAWFGEVLKGVSYIHEVAPEDGEFNGA
ncbi:MAG: S26 family signal peptidase, partial [Verrucomicrobiota bacterium]